MEIIICYAGQRNQASLRYYGLLVNSCEKEYEQMVKEIKDALHNLVNSCEKEYEQKVKEIKDALYNNALSKAERQSLINQNDALHEEKDALKEKLEEQALIIARINQGKASDSVKPTYYSTVSATGDNVKYKQRCGYSPILIY